MRIVAFSPSARRIAQTSPSPASSGSAQSSRPPGASAPSRRSSVSGRHPAREASTASVGEGTEGRLLHLEGTMVGPLVDDSPYGYKLEIDDGSGPVQIFLYPGTGISTQGLAPGAEIELDCFSSQFDTHYECDPPTAGDFHVE